MSLMDSLRTVYAKYRFVKTGSVGTLSVGGTSAKYHNGSKHEFKEFVWAPEEPLLKEFLDDLDSKDTFWDVGANIGLWTCLAAQHVESVAIEPVPANVHRLQENLALNRLNAHVVNAALGDATGVVQIDVDEREASTLPGLGGHRIALDGDSSLLVGVVSGDELRRCVPSPSVVKIDVEGAESRVVDGMAETLADCRRVFVEVHDSALESYGDSREQLVEQVETMGFSTWSPSVPDRPDKYLIADREADPTT